MMCYDKKLEASRADFYSEAYGCRDVDLVLTTGPFCPLYRLTLKQWNYNK